MASVDPEQLAEWMAYEQLEPWHGDGASTSGQQGAARGGLEQLAAVFGFS